KRSLFLLHSRRSQSPVCRRTQGRQDYCSRPAASRNISGFLQVVTADNELVRLGNLEFYPGASAPAAFVDGIWSFGDKPLEAELSWDPQQLIFAAAKLTRESDILRSFFQAA